MRNKHLGFTLIELMISLALGLIVVAAAILLFLTGQKSVAMQKGVAELQDNANFGLNYITKDIRLTNLNVMEALINDQTSYGGVVLSSSATEVKSNVYLASPAFALDPSLLSKEGLTSNVLVSNNSDPANFSAGGSDQLVIQYLPQYSLKTISGTEYYVGGFDCEGEELKFKKSDGLQMVVQRYFLRSDDNKVSNENSPLALACDAGHYSINAPTAVVNYDGAGEIIMKRVDHFRVLLGVQFANGSLRYMPISAYKELTSVPRPRILSIQLGALVRSTQSVGGDAVVKADQTFQVLDQTVKVKTSSDPKYIRQVVSQTIALRNALGERE
ncbi:PilW family protein [Acinetobacter tandoii]|uniref:PilW family protein n=1 Tax=Acinetobacter tandoii TaxID=202954 RepID=UPI000C2038AD|nr:PilW family protein [Acinetobacter tandoii]